MVESSTEGVRKPEPEIYRRALTRLSDAVGRPIEPSDCAYLDDLGINLKPARELGFSTIKVVDPAAALAELSALIVDLTDLPRLHEQLQRIRQRNGLSMHEVRRPGSGITSIAAPVSVTDEASASVSRVTLLVDVANCDTEVSTCCAATTMSAVVAVTA